MLTGGGGPCGDPDPDPRKICFCGFGWCVHVSKIARGGEWFSGCLIVYVLFCSCDGDARVEEHEMEGVRL